MMDAEPGDAGVRHAAKHRADRRRQQVEFHVAIDRENAVERRVGDGLIKIPVQRILVGLRLAVGEYRSFGIGNDFLEIGLHLLWGGVERLRLGPKSRVVDEFFDRRPGIELHHEDRRRVVRRGPRQTAWRQIKRPVADRKVAGAEIEQVLRFVERIRGCGVYADNRKDLILLHRFADRRTHLVDQESAGGADRHLQRSPHLRRTGDLDQHALRRHRRRQRVCCFGAAVFRLGCRRRHRQIGVGALGIERRRLHVEILREIEIWVGRECEAGIGSERRRRRRLRGAPGIQRKIVEEMNVQPGRWRGACDHGRGVPRLHVERRALRLRDVSTRCGNDRPVRSLGRAVQIDRLGRRVRRGRDAVGRHARSEFDAVRLRAQSDREELCAGNAAQYLHGLRRVGRLSAGRVVVGLKGELAGGRQIIITLICRRLHRPPGKDEPAGLADVAAIDGLECQRLAVGGDIIAPDRRIGELEERTIGIEWREHIERNVEIEWSCRAADAAEDRIVERADQPAIDRRAEIHHAGLELGQIGGRQLEHDAGGAGERPGHRQAGERRRRLIRERCAARRRGVKQKDVRLLLCVAELNAVRGIVEQHGRGWVEDIRLHLECDTLAKHQRQGLRQHRRRGALSGYVDEDR